MVGGTVKRMLQRASQHYGWMECLGRWECDVKEGMLMMFVHREMAPSYRLPFQYDMYLWIVSMNQQVCWIRHPVWFGTR